MTTLVLLAACADETQTTAPPAPLDRDDLPREDVKSGYEFLTRDTQNLQDDDFANPGFLWVDRGRD
ncbi:MAG: sulfur oxidation c-type cytochrome SoxA, partial [Pseudomonadota bacterium]